MNQGSSTLITRSRLSKETRPPQTISGDWHDADMVDSNRHNDNLRLHPVRGT